MANYQATGSATPRYWGRTPQAPSKHTVREKPPWRLRGGGAVIPPGRPGVTSPPSLQVPPVLEVKGVVLECIFFSCFFWVAF